VSARDIAPLAISAALAGVLAPGALRALPKRPNFRAVQLPFPMGVVAVVAGILTLGVMALWDKVAEPDDGTFQVFWDGPDFTTLFLGVAFLGLLDDLLNADPRGWRGHGRAALRGAFSTGAFKAAGTFALAAAVLFTPGEQALEILLAVFVVALATNLFNLLDLRPGRSWKAFLLLGAVILVIDRRTELLRVVGPFAGALLVLGVLDLRERCMLGDTGANLFGAMAGVWLVLVLSTAGQVVAAVVLIAVTIFGEFASISATIERLPPLRFLDSLGRKEPDV
jgi:UDP-N-acetylmuramyl pentapeptide phosphotransferase/UDP-N-acetylglucosamine-1-phosphate transferase